MHLNTHAITYKHTESRKHTQIYVRVGRLKKNYRGTHKNTLCGLVWKKQNNKYNSKKSIHSTTNILTSRKKNGALIFYATRTEIALG